MKKIKIDLYQDKFTLHRQECINLAIKNRMVLVTLKKYDPKLHDINFIKKLPQIMFLNTDTPCNLLKYLYDMGHKEHDVLIVNESITSFGLCNNVSMEEVSNWEK